MTRNTILTCSLLLSVLATVFAGTTDSAHLFDWTELERRVVVINGAVSGIDCPQYCTGLAKSVACDLDAPACEPRIRSSVQNCANQCAGCEVNAQRGYETCVHNGQEFDTCIKDARSLYKPCMAALHSTFSL